MQRNARNDDLKNTIIDLLNELDTTTFEADLLRGIAMKAIDGVDVTRDLDGWLGKVFPCKRSKKHVMPQKETRGLPKSRKIRRREEYARAQNTWRRSRSMLARDVLDGSPRKGAHSLSDMVKHWAPVFETVSGG